MLKSAEYEIFVLLINLNLPTIPNSFLLNISEHENFFANKYENANYSFISREKFMLSWVEHKKVWKPQGQVVFLLN